jgi:peptidoglycan/LPS O-acetylase OafA/YrhL
MVVFDHWNFLFGPVTLNNGHRYISFVYKIFELTPLHLLVAGHEAVLLFFLLSGFVLTLSLSHPLTGAGYGRYITKRTIRLYLPFVGALFVAVLANSKWWGRMPSLSDWFNHVWQQPPDRADVLAHLTLAGDFNFTRFNVAFWSLVYEARISIVFPILVIFVRRWRWSTTATVAVCTSIISQITVLRYGHSSLWITLHYTSMFLIGIMLAVNRASIIRYFETRTARAKVSFWAAVGVLSMNQILKHVPGVLHRLEILTDWPAVLAASAVLSLAFSYEPLMRALRHKACVQLGHISFSMYLIHATVLFALVHSEWGRLSHLLLFAIYIPVTLAASSVFYWAVERPCMQLSRRIGRKHDRKAMA